MTEPIRWTEVQAFPSIPEGDHLQELRAKLQEYQDRLDPYTHPALQQSDRLKALVLVAALETGDSCDMQGLHAQAMHRFGDDFDEEVYNNAFMVVWAYMNGRLDLLRRNEAEVHSILTS